MMSTAVTPSFRTYPIPGAFTGAIAEFPSRPAEYLKVERFNEGLGVNWTTNLPSAQVPATIQDVLPGPASVEVWHRSAIDDTLTSDDYEGIVQAIVDQDTFRLTYEIDPGLVSKTGFIISWRIRRENVQPPYQMGIYTSPPEHTNTRDLIEATATPNIIASSGLLDNLLAQI